MNNFMNRDMATIEVNFNSKKFVICSVYVENQSLFILEHLKELHRYCKNQNRQLIIGGDFNAHHSNWGSDQDNSRGEKVVEFAASNEIVILNTGSKPTFVRTNGSSIIDLTMSTEFIKTKILDWKVSDEFSASDHKYITFSINMDIEMEIKLRVPKKTKWDLYSLEIKKKINSLPKMSKDIESLEKMAQLFENVIVEAYEHSCDLQTIKTNRNVPWWNSHLQILRTKVRKLEHRAFNKTLQRQDKKHERNIALNLYRTALTNYSKK